MATDVELGRIAAAVAMLRPDWHPRAVEAWLQSEAGRFTAARPFADLAVAVVACALDPQSKTPARVAQNGPWWATADRANDRAAAGQLPGPDGDPCPRPGHEHEPAAACRACRAELLAGEQLEDEQRARPTPAPDGWLTRAAEQLAARRILTRTDAAVRALIHAGANPHLIVQRAAASTLVVVANGVALEGEPRATLESIRAGGPHLLLGRPVELDDRVVDGVVEVDALVLDAPQNPDPGTSGVDDTTEDTNP